MHHGTAAPPARSAGALFLFSRVFPPIQALPICPDPSALVFVAPDVFEDIHLVLPVFNGHRVASALPELAEVPTVTKAEVRMFLGAADGRTHASVTELAQQMEVNGIHRKHKHLNLLVNKHFDQRLSDNLALWRGKLHRGTFQQRAGILAELVT